MSDPGRQPAMEQVEICPACNFVVSVGGRARSLCACPLSLDHEPPEPVIVLRPVSAK